MAGMTIKELQKKDGRTETFVSMIADGTPFTLAKGLKKFTAIDLRIQKSKTQIVSWDSKADIARNKNKIVQELDKLSGGTQQKIVMLGKINGGQQTEIVTSGEIAKSAEFGGKAGAPAVTPSTVQQEKVTLKIFEILLKNNGYNPDGKSEEKLKADFDKFVQKDLVKIWPGIDGDNKKQIEWYKHFYLQFKDIKKTTKLPNNVFNFYDYDHFMDFISDLVIGGPPNPQGGRTKKWPKFGIISQKDSWNPADVWLINKKGPAYKQLINKLQQSKYISQVNTALKEAWKGKNNGGVPVVTGISLKKSTGKMLHYELVNLQYNKVNLPQVEYNGFVLKLPFTKGYPDIVTNTMSVSEDVPGNSPGKKIAQMRVGSSGSDNLNLEFLAPGQAAQLGKLPKDLATARMRSLPGMSNAQLPTATESSNSIPDSTTDSKAGEWRKKLKQIQDYSGGGSKGIIQIPSVKDTITSFITNIMSAKSSAKWSSAEYRQRVLINIQIMEFAYLLTQIYKAGRSRANFDDVIEDWYYYAQKKGTLMESGFGPFGKLY
jgi:hypothetical protein